MRDYSIQNKTAWEYSAYDFWVKQNGTPAKLAQRMLADPEAMLRKYAAYFDTYEGIQVANICGSCGKKAIPLALLGAEVTVFDISRENCRYALETSEAAGVKLSYQVGDVLEIDLSTFKEKFDVVFMEGGVLHYFHNIDEFMQLMHALLRPGGKLILSDFHPFTKMEDALGLETKTMSYFATDVFQGEMAHARFYPEEIRRQMPTCSLRRYTISEIINGILRTGLTLERFDEHPAWADPCKPGEFTAIARKR